MNEFNPLIQKSPPLALAVGGEPKRLISGEVRVNTSRENSPNIIGIGKRPLNYNAMNNGDSLQSSNSPFLVPYSPSKNKTGGMFTPRFAARLMAKAQPGSMTSTIITLIVSIMGAGILSLPVVMKHAGVILGSIILALGGICAYFSLYILVTVATLTKHCSYQKLTQLSMGKVGQFFCALMLMSNGFSTCIAYTVGSGQVFFSVLQDTFGGGVWIFQSSKSVSVLICIICFPLCLLKTLNAFRFVSFLSVACCAVLSVILCVEYFFVCDYARTCFWNAEYKINFWSEWAARTDNPLELIKSVPLVVFAYTCHTAVLPLYLELQRRSANRMGRVLKHAISFTFVIYVFSSFWGFMTFLGATKGNILANDFGRGNIVILVARIFFGVALVILVPVNMYIFRLNFYRLVFKKDQVSTTRHLIVSTVSIICICLLSVLFDGLDQVLAIIGGLINPLICYVFPAWFALYFLGDLHGYFWTKVFAVIIAIIVWAISLLGTISTFVTPSS